MDLSDGTIIYLAKYEGVLTHTYLWGINADKHSPHLRSVLFLGNDPSYTILEHDFDEYLRAS